MAWAATGLLLIGCGSAAVGAGPSPTQTVTVSENDHVASVRVGQRLELVLHAPNGMTNWAHPESRDRSILAPTVDPAAAAAVGVTLAAFVGMKPGDTEVMATASPRCPPGAACPMYVALYSLKVPVTQ